MPAIARMALLQGAAVRVPALDATNTKVCRARDSRARSDPLV